jgi:hypothetical protein
MIASPSAFLDKAASLIKERGKTYDSPGGGIEESFTRAAAIASLWLDTPITPRDVALILASVKMARIASSPSHEDSFVDLCNYVAFAAAFSIPDGADETLAEKLDKALRKGNGQEGSLLSGFKPNLRG